jgi:hypothetical protein
MLITFILLFYCSVQTTKIALLSSSPTSSFHSWSPLNVSDIFNQNKIDVSSHHGYHFINSEVKLEKYHITSIGTNSIGQSLQWITVDILSHFIQSYDWIVWVDQNTLIVNEDFDFNFLIEEAQKSLPNVDSIFCSSSKISKGWDVISSIMIFKNTEWVRTFFVELKELLSDDIWHHAIHATSLSPLDNAIIFLMESDHSKHEHVYYSDLLHNWDDDFIYLPKINFLSFSGCSRKNKICQSVFLDYLNFIVNKENMIVFYVAPHIQHLYDVFVVIYTIFAIDRILHVFFRYFLKNRVRLIKKV